MGVGIQTSSSGSVFLHARILTKMTGVGVKAIAIVKIALWLIGKWY